MENIELLLEKLNRSAAQDCLYPTGKCRVNLKHLENNINILRKHANGQCGREVKVLIPVKGNGYGCGMLPVARFLEILGLCDYLGLAHFQEAYELREKGIRSPILLLALSPLTEKELDYMIENDIEQSVSDKALIDRIERRAWKSGKPAKIHLNVDTGMGRLGVISDGAFEVVDYIENSKRVKHVGVMTHFPAADSPKQDDIDYTQKQVKKMRNVMDYVQKKFEGVIFHTSNSGGVLEHASSIIDMIRPGIASYGLPEQYGKGLSLDIKPVMEVLSRVVLVKDYPEGHAIGYGRTYKTSERERVAVVPVGYADGLMRILSNQLTPLLGGKRTISRGRFSMDQFCIRASEDTCVGDEVVILGRRNGEEISAHELAKQAGTIPYEIVCSLGNAKRLRHEYVYE